MHGMDVTLHDLEQYMYLLKELKYLDKKLQSLMNSSTHLVADSVKGSSKQFPYNEVVIPIVGVSQKYVDSYVKAKARLETQINTIQEKTREIEKFIDTLTRSDIRQIIELRYIQGLKWKQVSSKVYGYSSEDRARKAIELYFLKNSEKI